LTGGAKLSRDISHPDHHSFHVFSKRRKAVYGYLKGQPSEGASFKREVMTLEGTCFVQTM